MLKKVSTLFCAAFLAVAFVGCDQAADSDSTGASSSTESSDTGTADDTDAGETTDEE